MAYRLIVADSSVSVHKTVQSAFPEEDFEVYWFEDGLDVLNAIPQIRPDALLVSLSLSSKDGYELGRYLRTRTEFRKTVLIFLRGAFEPLDSRKLENLVYDKIVQKPFDSGRLVRMTKDMIEDKKEILQLPEEPIMEDAAESEKDFGRTGLSAGENAEIEGKVREVVEKEIKKAGFRIEKMAKELISAEIKKWLVEELKGPRPKK